MAWLLIVLVAALAAVKAQPANVVMPEPGTLALLLNEEDFEDYLEHWLEVEEQKWVNVTDSERAATSSGCQLRVNGDLGQPEPVYLHNGDYMVPTGNTGVINLGIGEQVVIACTGSGRTINHPQISASVTTTTATCVNKTRETYSLKQNYKIWKYASETGWLSGSDAFGGLACSSNAGYEARYTGELCFDNNRVIRIGFIVNGVFYPKYWSCFNPDRLEVVYVWYEQNPPNGIHETNIGRPSWLVGTGFFKGISINKVYTRVTQKAKIATYVGNKLADKYVTSTQYLARGHLCAKTDMIFATGQRSTFYFINAAPQWQPFNAGNWNWVEQNLRVRIGQAGYHTMVYTGTFGVSQLRNENNELVDIYLHHDANNNPQLPVPLYFYKVVYEPSLRLGTAFISINNPYYTESEVRALQFCTDRCRNNSAFSWLHWQPDRIDIGYSFCCTIDDFRQVIRHLPDFEVNGILA